MTLSTMIVILFFLAIVHFVYWSTIAPNIRLKLRHDGFLLRDEIYHLKMKSRTKKELEVLQRQEKSIQHLMDRMSAITILNLIRIEYRQDKKDMEAIEREIEKFKEKIDSLNNQDIKKLDIKITGLFIRILAVNMGMHMLFLSPIYLMKSLFSKIKNWVSESAKIFELTPEYRYSEFHFTT